MINVKNYNAARNVANFIVDSVDEIALLPDLTKGGSLGLMDMGPVAMGSTVMIPTTGAIYMLNGNNVYTQIGAGGGGGSANAVLYTPQTLTDAQKLQARTNIGAGTGGGGDIPDNVVLFEETEDEVPNPVDQYIAENLGIAFNAETRYLDLTFGSVTLDHVSLDYTTVPCTGITLNKTELTIDTGATETLVATIAPSDCEQLVRWFSEDKSIATVDSTGKVTGVSEGEVNIIAKCGTKSVTCAVTCATSEWPKTASFGTRLHPTFPSGGAFVGGTVDNYYRGTTNIFAIKVNEGDAVAIIYRGTDTNWFVGASETDSKNLASDASNRLTDNGEWIELSNIGSEAFNRENCQTNITRSFDPGWAQITPNVYKNWIAPYSGLMYFNFKHGSAGNTTFTDEQLLDMKNFTFDVTRAE